MAGEKLGKLGGQGRIVRGVLADSLVRLNFESKDVSCPFDFSFSFTCTRKLAYLTLGLKQVKLTALKFFTFSSY